MMTTEQAWKAVRNEYTPKELFGLFLNPEFNKVFDEPGNFHLIFPAVEALKTIAYQHLCKESEIDSAKYFNMRTGKYFDGSEDRKNDVIIHNNTKYRHEGDGEFMKMYEIMH